MNPEGLMIASEKADLLDRYPEPFRARPKRWLDPRVADALYGDVYERARVMRIAERILPRPRNHGITLAGVLARSLGMGHDVHTLEQIGEYMSDPPRPPLFQVRLLTRQRASQILSKYTWVLGEIMASHPDARPAFPTWNPSAPHVGYEVWVHDGDRRIKVRDVPGEVIYRGHAWTRVLDSGR